MDCQSLDRVIRFDNQARPHRTTDPLSHGLADPTKPINDVSNQCLGLTRRVLAGASCSSNVHAVQ
ncbi:unnamed protein product [Penicillium camemberti]|uniref:Str. FM013 n=1 Tax=Penicillium camemberti (strain FM 013) TaxID=1429867 RepID=A0A0G4PXF9_PENC3|nr:unnamed protein product [Penicillium camemberti]